MRLFAMWMINYLIVVLGKLFGSKLYKDSPPVDNTPKETPKQTQIGDKDE